MKVTSSEVESTRKWMDGRSCRIYRMVIKVIRRGMASDYRLRLREYDVRQDDALPTKGKFKTAAQSDSI